MTTLSMSLRGIQETFPKEDGTTENYVSDIITELESEIIGFQEINDVSAFNTMMAATPGYSGYVLDANYGGINLAYAVKNDLSVIDDYAILSSSNYNYAFAGRPPYLIHVEKITLSIISLMYTLNVVVTATLTPQTPQMRKTED